MSESVEVPFTMIGNRRCLTAQQLVEDHALAAFVSRFPDSFEQSPTCDVWWFVESKS